ncbi:MAG: IS5 family transposase [Gammaproteobacteria bacterium]|jgi:IS5 family transposase
MRHVRTAQVSIYEQFSEHALGQELRTMSQWLDAHREVLSWVLSDLHGVEVNATSRRGLSAESVLRCALLKQHRQLSYEELAFYLCDSASFQAFARLPLNECPNKSALQRVVSCVFR